MDGLVVKLFFRDVDQDSGVKEMYTLMFLICNCIQKANSRWWLTGVTDGKREESYQVTRSQCSAQEV